MVVGIQPQSNKIQAPAQDVSHRASGCLEQLAVNRSRYHNINSIFCSDQFLTQALQTFGASKFSPLLTPRNAEPTIDSYYDSTLLSGYYRKHDHLVQNEISSRMTSDSNTTLRILEIGFGETYPSSNLIGAPFLLRKIGLALGGTVECIGIEIPTKNLCIFVTLRDGTLVYNELRNATSEAFSNKGLISQFKYNRSLKQIVALPINQRSLSTNYKLQIAAVVAEHYQGFTYNELSKCKIFIRPLIDPEFEEKNYGIKLISLKRATNRSSSDGLYKNISEHCDSLGKFDLIFGRRLYPLERGKEAIEAAAAIAHTRPLLTEKGRAILDFGRQLCPIIFDQKCSLEEALKDLDKRQN